LTDKKDQPPHKSGASTGWLRSALFRTGKPIQEAAMHIDDATAFIIDYIQSPRSADGYPSYGYEVYLPNVIAAHLTEVEPSTTHHFQLRNSPRARELSPAFYEAAWDLCRRVFCGQVSRWRVEGRDGASMFAGTAAKPCRSGGAAFDHPSVGVGGGAENSKSVIGT
jgi:hypothetical protein